MKGVGLEGRLGSFGGLGGSGSKGLMGVSKSKGLNTMGGGGSAPSLLSYGGHNPSHNSHLFSHNHQHPHRAHNAPMLSSSSTSAVNTAHSLAHRASHPTASYTTDGHAAASHKPAGTSVPEGGGVRSLQLSFRTNEVTCSVPLIGKHPINTHPVNTHPVTQSLPSYILSTHPINAYSRITPYQHTLWQHSSS